MSSHICSSPSFRLGAFKNGGGSPDPPDMEEIYRDLSPALIATTGISQNHSIIDISPTWQGLRGLTIYGDTPQVGTPTPEAPIPLVGVVDPAITVDTTSAALAGITLNGVGGVRDTIDVTDSKVTLTRRVQKRTFDGSENWQLQGTNTNGIISFTLVFVYRRAGNQRLYGRYKRPDRRRKKLITGEGEHDEGADGEAAFAHYALHRLKIRPGVLFALSARERAFIYASISLQIETEKKGTARAKSGRGSRKRR